jgi:hypothetical protein
MPSRRDSLRERIAVQAAASDDEVFLTREFRHLGCERHVLRALGQLVAQGRLIRLGYGVYGRAGQSGVDGEPVLMARGGFIGASQQVLDKLGVSWEPGSVGTPANDDQLATASLTVRVKGSRIIRKLRHQNRELVLERR